MTVGELRKALEGVPDDMEVLIQTDNPFGCEADEAGPKRLADIYGHDDDPNPDQLFFLIN
jgi:hypothetical protein